MLEQPRFRAGLDFLRLRGEVGEADPALAEWWEAFFQASDDERYRDARGGARAARRPRRVRRVPAAAAGGPAATARPTPAGRDAVSRPLDGDGSAADDEPAPSEGQAPRKRRRRRRRPSEPAADTTAA